MSAGRCNVGGVVSTTVVWKLSGAAVLPDASVAVHCTVVCPSAKVLPEYGVQTTPGFRSQLSIAVAEKVTTAPPGPVASCVMSAGIVSTGGVVSTATLLAAALLM